MPARNSYLKNTSGGDFVEQKFGGTLLTASQETSTIKPLQIKDSAVSRPESTLRESSDTKKLIESGKFAQLNKLILFGILDQIAGISSSVLNRLGGAGRSSDNSSKLVGSSRSSVLHERIQQIKPDPENEWDWIFLIYIGDYGIPGLVKVRSSDGYGSNFNLIVDWGNSQQTQIVAQPSGSSELTGNLYPYGTFNGWKIVKIKGDADKNINIFTSPTGSGIYDYSGIRKIYKFKPEEINHVAFFDNYKCKTLPNLPFNSTSLYKMFYQNAFLESIDLSGWDVSSVTTMESAFRDTKNLSSINANDWDTSNVTNMLNIFSQSSFNGNISNWDTSAVTNMMQAFSTSNFNQPINQWDVSNVTNMTSIFADSSFNQPLNSWNTSNVSNFSNMFRNSKFNNDVSGFSIQGNVDHMFGGTFNVSLAKFNHPSINNVDVSNATSFYMMFRDNKVFNQPLSSWNTSNVTNMNNMFSGCSAFNQDLSSWDTSNVTNMSQAFLDCVEFNQDLSSWDISSVTDMSGLFMGCKKFNKPILWDLRNVTKVSSLVSGCEQFNQDVSGWNLGESGATIEPANLFLGCSSFDQDISSWKYRNFVYNFAPYPPFDTINFGFASFLGNCGMSPQNYDLFLQALDSESNFAPLNTQQNYLTATGVAYTAGGAGEAARNSLVAKGWVVEDAGAV